MPWEVLLWEAGSSGLREGRGEGLAGAAFGVRELWFCSPWRRPSLLSLLARCVILLFTSDRCVLRIHCQAETPPTTRLVPGDGVHPLLLWLSGSTLLPRARLLPAQSLLV